LISISGVNNNKSKIKNFRNITFLAAKCHYGGLNARLENVHALLLCTRKALALGAFEIADIIIY